MAYKAKGTFPALYSRVAAQRTSVQPPLPARVLYRTGNAASRGQRSAATHELGGCFAPA
jgi:hypothetical protein